MKFNTFINGFRIVRMQNSFAHARLAACSQAYTRRQGDLYTIEYLKTIQFGYKRFIILNLFLF